MISNLEETGQENWKKSGQFSGQGKVRIYFSE